MKRAPLRNISYSAEVSDIRVVLHLGADNFILDAQDAYQLADMLVDCAEDLTKRLARMEHP
ncbi:MULTISPECIES: hypothetical protein [Rhodococcus]|uniref:hypothetical protein n=1 Tax=Rhodococcus TaxID=1827 RepID=UPI0007D9CC69|nr:hypothetical protein [Rhodococcus sp. HS-D2]